MCETCYVLRATCYTCYVPKGLAVHRYHSLDALRAAMMLLGLVLHSAASYTQAPLREAWPYQDAQTSVAFDLLAIFIHVFRMPVFFVIAGFFAALLYERDGLTGFLLNRARRVLLPLVFFWPAVIPIAGIGFIFAIQRRGVALPPKLVGDEPLLHRPILGHLWFLYDLLIFYVAIALIARLASRVPERLIRVADVVFRSAITRFWGLLVIAAVSTLTLIPMRVDGIESSSAVLPPIRILAAYGAFFAFGWLLYRQRDLIGSFGASWKSRFAAGIVAVIVYLAFLVRRPIPDPSVSHVVAVALASLTIWLLIFGIVGVFVRHMDAQRPAVRYLSDASYWMYLVHAPLTIWLPGVLANSTAPAGVKFAIVLSLTTLVTLITYHSFVRTTAIGALLNGRRYPHLVTADAHVGRRT